MQAPFTSYDSILYPSYTHPQTHPGRLAVIGTLFGLKPAPVGKCRVLELGCGNGTNLVPMAAGLPAGEFVGIDLASVPILRGQQMIADLGLTNVRLVQGNVMEINAGWGSFDYVIAHGLYSWVPAGVQKKILELCQTVLNPQGIAFISYNALPGCHLRQMLREMLAFHVRGFDSAPERVKQALALVQFLASAQTGSSNEYQNWMQAESKQISEHDEGHIFHDELAEINDPLYFTQFMEQAAAQGLEYVGEADFFEMSDFMYPGPVRETLERLGTNRILREQYLDFIKCRRFRQTLLCRQGAGIQSKPQAGPVAGFLVSSAVAAPGGILDFRPGVDLTFETPKGAKVLTDLPIGKSALAVLAQAWPRPLPFAEVLGQAARKLSQAGVPSANDETAGETLSEFLLRLYAAGAVEFHATPPPVAVQAGERPLAWPVARWQAERGDFVTSLFHMAVKVEDEIGRTLLASLDGTMDREALIEKLWSLLKTKDALLVPEGRETAARKEIETRLEENLQKLARLGLLAG